MKNVIFIIQIVIASLLIIAILIQAKGVGLSSAFGGEGGFYRSKRGFEKLLIYVTTILALLFAISSISSLILSSIE